ncbi:MAG: cell division protein FtsB [Neisseria sp.]|nr:cell division protein FtsB [Neisseria sp.]
MKWVTLILTVALGYFHYHLWIAKGGWQDMSKLKDEVAAQDNKNTALALRNTALAAEVADLAEGKEAIAEIARVDLGYIEEGETYYRLVKRFKH